MTAALDQLAAAVLLAQTARRKAAEARCTSDTSNEDECVRLDDESEAARARLEAAHKAFFDAWRDELLEARKAAHAARETLERHLAKARESARVT